MGSNCCGCTARDDCDKLEKKVEKTEECECPKCGCNPCKCGTKGKEDK